MAMHRSVGRCFYQTLGYPRCVRRAIDGAQTLEVFAPTFPLPLPHQKSKELQHECPLEPVFDGVLEAGDVLYLPRGWWHEAIPLQNEETFFISL